MIRRWRALEPWIEGPKFRARRYAFDTAPLGKILTRRVSPIDKEARPARPTQRYRQGDVRLESCFSEARTRSEVTKGHSSEALPDDLIISKIRVGQGSFCVIGGEFDHVAVSPEYPVYTPDCERINLGYLALVLRTPNFLAQLAGAASGNTTKRRIRPEFFESRDIPLPLLDEQRTIVAAYRAALNLAAGLDREAEKTEARAAEAFEEVLGFGSPTPLPDRPCFRRFLQGPRPLEP